MKKTLLLSAAAIILGAGIFLLQCNLTEVFDDGGSGADFDAASYYTKAEIDAKIAAATQIFVANEDTKPIGGVGFDGSTATWTLPANCYAVVMWITVNNASTSTDKNFTLQLSGTSAPDETPRMRFRILAEEKLTMPVLFRLNTSSSTITLWVDGTETPDLTDLTISAMPVYWWRNMWAL